MTRRWPPILEEPDAEPVRPFVLERRKLEAPPLRWKPKQPRPERPRPKPKRRRPIWGAPKMKGGSWDYNSSEDEG
jgi:hypothetical protein